MRDFFQYKEIGHITNTVGYTAEADPDMSLALDSFFVGLMQPKVPTKPFDSMGNAVVWVKTIHSK